jgi:hypothetical protein
MSSANKIREELEAIAEANNGLLLAEDVVEFAKDPNTALHDKFNWDDTSAAIQYRLHQARQIIRVNVTVVDNVEEPVKVFFSLNEDRYNRTGGGYRQMIDIMSDDQRRAALLAQALAEAKAWRKRYNALKELSAVFSALDEVAEMAQRS